MHLKFFPAIIFFTLNSLFAFSQQEKIRQYLFGIEPEFRYGKIWKHTVNFKPEVEKKSFTAQLNLMWQSTGQKEWQRMLNYPVWGLDVGYTSFGNKKILGSEFFLVPDVQFRLAGKENIQLWLKGGVGIAWLTKHYDAIENPTNNVIASSINNCSTISLRLKVKMNPKLNLVIGSSFTHSSTGDVRMPNLGINIPANEICLQYFFHPVYETAFNETSLTTEKRKSLVLTTRNGIGLYEIFIPDGPIYPILINETGIGKFAGRWNLFSLGLETYYSTANFTFVNEQQIGTHRAWESVTLSPFIQDEMQWGPVSFSMMIAYQVKQAQLSGYSLYQKLGLNHTLCSFGENKNHKLSAGVFLTTHLSNADYVSALLSLQL